MQQKMAFVLTRWYVGVYESKFWDECPEGAAVPQDELWWRQLSKVDRGRMTDNGNIDTNTRIQSASRRGPNGENICWNPTVIKVPLGREARSDVSYGLNLDGTEDGHATARTCNHEKFKTTPDHQETSVDNQLFRAIGCYLGWRNFKVIDEYANQDRRASGHGQITIEITGIDDPRNDDDVEVAFYRAVNPMPVDASATAIPFASYEVDEGPRYRTVAHGRIVNGVLLTDPVDVVLPRASMNVGASEISLRRMRLKLAIAPDGSGAKGEIAGYYDLVDWWHEILMSEATTSHGDLNCPAMYEALHRLADGDPDPSSGQCTTISSAFNIEMAGAYVIHQNVNAGKKDGAENHELR